nr:zinc finger, CCHC-type [Tanacetum cinerariifolium]
MPELLEDATVEAIRIREKWENDDYICRGHLLNGMSDSLFDVYTNVESAKVLWDSLESMYMAEDSSKESLRAQDSDKGKDKEVGGPSVNMTKEDKRKCNKQKRLVTSRGIAEVVRRRMQMLVVRERGLRTIPKTNVDAIAWWIDSGTTTHVCKDRCWFKTYEPVEDGSKLYMGDDHFAPVHGKVYESDKYILSKCGVFVRFGYYNNGMFMLNLNKVSDDWDSVHMSSSSTVVNFLLWHARLGHVHYKRMLEISVVRLPDPKRNTLGEKGIDCIFVGYAKHSKAYSTRPDIAYAIGRLSRFTSNPSRQHWKSITRVFKYLRGTMNYGLSSVGYSSMLEAYSDASWINHVEDSSSTSRWVFLLGRSAISWASKKQTCINGFTMESEFVALAAGGKKAEWLRNVIHEILIWSKPIAPIYIRCDSAPTIARAYSQTYNEKSRHLGVKYSMVRELTRNGVISIEFVQIQHNLADHLMNGLARDLVYKSVIGMRLKSI